MMPQSRRDGIPYRGPVKQAVVAVINRGDRFLYIERGPAVPFTGYWTPPSGGIDAGEGPTEALVREMREELGITVAPVRKVWECPSHDGAYTLHWWLADLVDGEPEPDGAEVAAVEWLTPAEIAAKEPIFADDLRFFDEVWPGLAR